MDQTISTVKKLPAIIAAIVIIAGSLVISRVVTYEYSNPKLFSIEIGLVLVIASVLFLYSFAVWKKAFHQPVVWGMGLFLLTLLISTFTSIDHVISWFGNVDRGTGTFFLAILIIAACALGTSLDKITARKYILMPIGLTGVLVSLSVYAEQFGWKVLATGGQGGFMGNSSVAGTYLLMAFFIILYLFLSNKNRIVKLLYGTAMAIMLINPIFINLSFFSTTHSGLFSLIGQARGATASIFFGLAVALSVWLITSIKNTKKIIGTMLLSLLIVFTIGGSVLLATPNTAVHNWFVKKESDVRFIYWNIALEGFKAHPLTGTGPETYSYTYQKYLDPIVMLPEHSGEIWSNKPHNAYLEVLSETGIIGAIGYVALFAGLLFSMIRLYQYDRDKRFLAVMSGLLAAYLLNNLIFFDTITSYLLLFMMISVIVAASPYQHMATISKVAWQKIARYFLGGLLIIGALAIVIPQLIKTHRAYEEFLLPLDQRTTWYQKIENTASYGSGLFLAQRADFEYQSVFSPNLGEILQQPAANKAIAAGSIQGLINTLENSFKRYPINEEGELTAGRLASIKMVILNAPDPASLATMKSAAQAAISISPTNPNGYLLLGQEYIYEQNYTAAYAQFEKARALVPAFIQPQLALINLATILDDTRREAFYIARAKQESPDFVATMNNH